MKQKPTRGLSLFILAGALAAWPVMAWGQDIPRTQADSLRAQIAQLRAQLDSIGLLLERGEAEPAEEEDALARLRAAARAAAGGAQADAPAEPEGDQEFVGRSRSLQALNPEISVTGDIYVSVQSEDPDADNFVPREFEFSFVSALDPFTRAKIFVSAEEEGAGVEVFPGAEEEEEEHGTALVVEEGYMEWVGIAGGLGIKVGRFFQQFGQLNRWHGHALQFQSRSLPHLAFIGEEALAQDGVSLHWLLPNSGGGAYETTFEVTRSRNDILFGESHGLSYLGHFNAFWQLSSSTDLDLGFSAVFGDHVEEDGQFTNRLFGAEASFNWIPPDRSLYRGFTLRGGVMLSDPGAVAGLPAPESALGLWSLAELKLSRQWIASGRYEWVENPEDPSQTAWLASPALTYWQSEFVRLRAEYDILGNPGETTGQFTLRITFAMGPHRHETY